MAAFGPLVTSADFPIASDDAFDGEVSLLRITELEVTANGKSEGKNGQRETGGEVILVGEERIGGLRVKALLFRFVVHVR